MLQLHFSTSLRPWPLHSHECYIGLGYPCRCGGAEREAQVRAMRRLAWWARECVRAGAFEMADAYLGQLVESLDSVLGEGGIQLQLEVA
jgi:hypothetical protein